MNQLRLYNGSLCILHSALAVGFALYFHMINDKYKNDPVRGIELSIRSHSADIADNFIPHWESKETISVSITTVQILLVSFFAVTAVFHALYFLTNDGLYSKMIQSRNNYLRWVEYSISSTIMLYIIALISGVKDSNVYILITATNIAMIMQGQLIEEAVANNRDWVTPMIAGFLLLFAEFAVIIHDFESRIQEVENIPNGPKMPQWIKYMIIVLFLFYSSFGFVSLYGAYNKTPYETVEKIYLLLSLVSKATLGAFIAYGTGQRQAAMNSRSPVS
ncbi:MAG: hypothetical protein EBV19_10390 [Flavobacteriia bacterium]|nr:hypothetical protein [Flavobacteriia bacterium]